MPLSPVLRGIAFERFLRRRDHCPSAASERFVNELGSGNMNSSILTKEDLVWMITVWTLDC